LRRFTVELNLLHGRIEYIGGAPLGIVLLDVTGERNAVAESIAYLRARTAAVEVLSTREAVYG
jgi:D-methionine transport system ATP-binding protein